ncbi:MAG: hypothetical protein NVSMB58_37730 [Terriglobales bacterium]
MNSSLTVFTLEARYARKVIMAFREVKAAISRTEVERMWTDRLDTIPSVFARLFYLSSLRQKNGMYAECAMSSLASGEIADEIIRRSHVLCFRIWLSMDLAQKTDDLEPYLRSLVPLGKQTEILAKSRPENFTAVFRELIPSDASLLEIRFFLVTVSIVQKLVKHRNL